jgi:hypothetical protein
MRWVADAVKPTRMLQLNGLQAAALRAADARCCCAPVFSPTRRVCLQQVAEQVEIHAVGYQTHRWTHKCLRQCLSAVIHQHPKHTGDKRPLEAEQVTRHPTRS